MSKRTTIVLAVIAAGLLAFILVYERHTLSSGDLEGREGRLLQTFVRDRVTKLEIEREDGRVVLERTRSGEDELGEWRITEPVAADVDFDAVDSVMGALEWADARRTLTGISAEDRERFGLTSPRLRAWFTVADRRVPIAIGGEDPQESGLYAQLEDESVAYVVGRDVYEALDHDAGWFREKELLTDVGPSRAERLTLEGEAGERRLVRRDGRWWLEAPVEGLASAGAVQEILRKLEDSKAERFVADAPESLAQYGLDAPAHVARVARTRGDGNETVEAVLAIGGPCGEHEGELYARVDDGPVVCVDADTVEPLGRDVDALREGRLLSVRDDEVERITIASGNRELEVWREGGEWKLRSKQGPRETEASADPEGVADFLRTLRDTRAQAFLPADPEAVRARGLTNPTATVTVGLASSEEEARTEVVTLGAVEADAAWARRGEEPALLQLSPAVAQTLSTSPLPFRARRLVREDGGQVTRLLVRRPEVREVVEDGSDGSRVVEPLAAPADAAALRAAGRELASLTAERFVAERATAEHGLDAPRLVVEATFEDAVGAAAEDDGHDHAHDHGEAEESAEGAADRPATRSYVLRVGASTEGGAFARLGDDAAVFVVSEQLVDALDGPLVDRGLLGSDARHVERLRIERGAQRLDLRRQGDGWTTEGGPADGASADALLRTLETLRATDTTSYGPAPAAAGLTRPRARITVTRSADAPEPREYTIVVGATEGEGEGAPVHARRADLDVGFLLPAQAASVLLGDAR